MAIRDRGPNYFVDYEDTGFGSNAMEQNEALANIISPPVAAPIPAPVEKPAETPAPKTNDATIEALMKQIQARSDTSRWTGGYGADQATKDMARILAETGITDIKQFGPITREVQKVVGYEDWGDPIYQTVTEQTFGNKETGKAVPNTYTERQTGNFFGGTYEGKGNTGYGVQFDPQGNPVFYTQGASSSDIGKIAPLLTLASFVPGLQPFAMAANAAIAAKQDNPLGVITNLAGVGNLAGVSGMADVANAARFAGAVQSGDPLAIAFSGANLAGVSDVGGVNLKDVSKAIGAVKAIESGDPLAMMLYGIDAIPKDNNLKSSLGPGNEQDFIDNLIPGYFQPGGAGYTEPAALPSPDEDFVPTMPAPEEMTVQQEPANIEEFIKSLEPYIAPAPTPEPEPAPAPTPEPEPEPAPAPEPIPEPAPYQGDPYTEPYVLPQGDPYTEPYVLPQGDPYTEPYVLPQGDPYTEPYTLEPTPAPEEMTVQPEPANLEEFLKSLESYIAPAEKLEELVMTTNRDKTQEHVFDPTYGGTLPLDNLPYLPTDDDFVPTNEIEVPETPTTPVATPKVPAPAVKPTTPAPSAPSSGMDLMGLLALLGGQQQPTQQAPMQDPYAHIKLMEDLFGSTIDLTPAGENTAQRK